MHMSDGYPLVDAVLFDGDGYGLGIRRLLLDRGRDGPVEAESGVALVAAGNREIFGWGCMDGECTFIERLDGLGCYAVSSEDWAAAKAWNAR